MKSKRVPRVEFYELFLIDRVGMSWRLRAPNGQIIMSPHESFTRHGDAVRSFATCAHAMNAQAVLEVTGFAPAESQRLLVGM